MQEQWSRIWTGYVAFATTGDLANQMAKRGRRPPAVEEKIVALIGRLAPKARLNHGEKRLGGQLLKELFADPAALMSALVESGMIRPGKPDASPFFDLLTPDGPMYRIFSDAEIDTWKQWVTGLSTDSPARASEDSTRPAVAERMQLLVDGMRDRQVGVPAHGDTLLVGPDPTDAAGSLTKPVSWWFQQGASQLMRAIARVENGWVVPGDAEASKWITELVRGRSSMGLAFTGSAPDGSTWAETAVEWVNAGCPQPGDGHVVRPLTLLSPSDRVALHPTGEIHGSGSVH